MKPFFVVVAENAIAIKDGSFSWGGDSDVFLKNVNLTVPQQSLAAVVGTVGSGKSTLVSSLLADTEKLAGSVNTYGSIAYVPQQAWMLNATLKVNAPMKM